MATTEWEEGEWELVNDDGFVYKRKKRQRLDPTAADTSVPPPPDPEAEEESRRERKKRALTKLRDKYQKEIDKWELLSNMLKSLEGKAQHQQRQQHQLDEQTTESSSEALAAGLPAPSQNSSESAARRVLENLLLRVEAEEAVIEDISNLCDVAEAMCNLQEEHMKQSLVDLPIWAAPLELMASLCDD